LRSKASLTAESPVTFYIQIKILAPIETKIHTVSNQALSCKAVARVRWGSKGSQNNVTGNSRAKKDGMHEYIVEKFKQTSVRANTEISQSNVTILLDIVFILSSCNIR
jgi:hypothetical protein